MYSLNKIIKTIGLVGGCALAITTARAVDPPPDGGYANYNTAEGEDALFSLTTGLWNNAIGFEALFSNTVGSGNTATGYLALHSNVDGGSNTADGYQALFSNVSGIYNTATGVYALSLNTTGNNNTASGWSALYSNVSGTNNTATGFDALVFSTVGNENTATGTSSLFFNTAGNDNTATGFRALYSNKTGINNTANGVDALHRNQRGNSNTATGYQALLSNRDSNFNTAIGTNAMINNTDGSNNIALGYQAGINLSGDDNIDIGNPGVRAEAGTIRIGRTGTHTNTYISGISGATVPAGVGVIVDTNGHLGTVVSSARFKDSIKPMDKASEAILSLQPVTFRYKKDLDPKGIPQFGLVAEQVEKVNPDLVARDAQGKPYTVRYEAVNAMLLNEFIKEHRKVEEQGRKGQEEEATITELRSMVAQQQQDIKALTVTLKEQAAQIQKVTRLRQVENSGPTPRLVTSD